MGVRGGIESEKNFRPFPTGGWGEEATTILTAKVYRKKPIKGV